MTTHTDKNSARRMFAPHRLGLAMLMAALFLWPGLPAQAAVTGGGVEQTGDGDGVFLPLVTQPKGGTPGNIVDSPEDEAIALLVAVPNVGLYLAGYPGWHGDAYEEGSNADLFNVDFYSAGDEWIGWGQANVTTGEVTDYYVPRELTAEEYAAQKPLVDRFILHDPEIAARLVEPALWGSDTQWNRWEQRWEVYYWYGIDSLVVILSLDGDNVYLQSIADPELLEAEAQDEANRNKAMEIAWSADGLWARLEGRDDWRTYVEPVEGGGGNQYTVEFVSGDETLFAALVDIATETILASQ